MDYQDIIRFWFDEIDKAYWFKKDDEFDQVIRTRFMDVYEAASQCELYKWRESAEGSLAEIIILDQFSRNLYRGSGKAFIQDPLALCLAQSAIKNKFDEALPNQQRSFMYMPFMHSESLVIQDKALKLYSIPGLESNLNFAHRHRKIIVEFGRYPHRNKALGRASSKTELEFLNKPGSSF